MLGPILIVVLIVRALTGHGREIECAPQTCQVEAVVALAKEDPYPVAVNMGPHPEPAAQLAAVEEPK